jgi:3-oxoacyl-(acyl-carrier-protein) synthase
MLEVPVTVDLIFGVVLMPCVSVLLNIIIPEQGTRPMSASIDLFREVEQVLVLEDLETASRGVRIYAEVLGGNINSGQRGLGTMTAPNPIAVQRCITSAMASAGIQDEVDTINGHLTANKRQFRNRKLSEALGRSGIKPYNSLKSMIGHCLSAAGSIESIAALQLHQGFFSK